MEHTMWGDIHISMVPLAQRSAIAWGRRAMYSCCQQSRGKCHTNANRLTEAAPKLPKVELCSVLVAVLKTCCCPPRQRNLNTYGNGWNGLFWVELDPVQAHQADGAQYVKFLCGQMQCRGNPYLYNIWSGGSHMCTLTLHEKKASVTWVLDRLRVILIFSFLLWKILLKKALQLRKLFFLFVCLFVKSSMYYMYSDKQFIVMVLPVYN